MNSDNKKIEEVMLMVNPTKYHLRYVLQSVLSLHMQLTFSEVLNF
jgi:hypothetical protein